MLGTQFVKGSPVWLDLGSPDTGASAAFYGAVLGWEFHSAGPEAGGYGFFRQDGLTVAALGPLTEEGASSAWTVYFGTPDADATQRATEAAGGAVRAPASDVMDAGRMAALTDPAGARFAIWQPGTTRGLERTSATNTLVWVELHTADPEATLGFYRDLFGWRWAELGGGGMTYRVLSTAEGDQQDASFGGATELQGPAEPAQWIPYFAVADADAFVDSVRGNGGSVLMPAADVPDVGRIAALTDPFGAPFAVLKPAPRG
ncbi:MULTISPECIES: VOC family protein [unclassified Streptomyces]|uniref:VOC family protein n=1 Tax=unclassified Streptomyces TaxID=2593676 RepID=UPI001661223E|nr:MULTISPECIES: VOC family protein [unclassified Streptomyces]MBD0709014.1 hydroxylase [Streptomyces sp. CBMA291]MBD0715414.1 hydroxylase [Streptomyces sp. CBMA370]